MSSAAADSQFAHRTTAARNRYFNPDRVRTP
jgi:hypothetical protein